MTTERVDIFELLGKIDTKQPDLFSSYTEEEQKTIAPYVIMRWLSGISSARQIIFINELVNPYVFTLGKDKDLLLKLLSICTNGRQQRYKWVKQAKKEPSFPLATKLVKEYFGYNTKHAKDALPILTNDDMIGFAEELGYQPEDIKKLKVEMKKRV